MVVDRGVLPLSNILDKYQKVDEFTYLDSLIQANGGLLREIRRRVILGRKQSTDKNRLEG